MGDGENLRHPGVASILARNGFRVGVFGSMNLNYGSECAYLVPDPWDRRGKTYPAELQPFYDAVASMVKEPSRYGGSKRTWLSLVRFLVRHGLRPQTVRRIFAQLRDERRDPGLRWRRAIILDLISYDVFRWLNNRFHPDFVTFFSNSTAHFQHYYWQDMEPQSFPPRTQPSHPSLKTAILEGYRAMDALLGNMLADYPSAKIVLCSALSQGPHEVAGGVHRREGVFWIMGQPHRINRNLVSVCDIAPTVLRLFDLPPASDMRGRELLERRVPTAAG